MNKITFLLFTLFSVGLFGQVKLTSSLSESFDGTSWSTSSKFDYKYDASGNLTKEIEKESYQYIYSYNTSNKLVEEIYFNWDSSISEFESDGQKTTYTYNTKGLLIETNLDNQKDLIKVVYSYNSNDIIISFIEYIWVNNSWVKNSEGTANYNSNNQIESTVTLAWQDKNATVWGNYSSQLYTYNTINKVVEEIYKEWNISTNSLENITKTTFEYDANGNKIKEKLYFFEDGTWNFNNEENFTYDTSKLMSSFIHPFKDKTGGARQIAFV